MDVLNVNNFPEENFVWYKNLDGMGNFGPPQEIGMINEPRFMTVGDLDGDGDIDVMGTSPFTTNPTVVWYENQDGNGNFGLANEVPTPLTQGENAIAIADIDGDNDNDLIIGSRNDDTLAWYENIDGNGTF